MATTWRVVPPQRFYDDVSTSGVFVPMIEITFEIIESHTQGQVRIPQRDYSVERVSQMIDEIASKMIEVEKL